MRRRKMWSLKGEKKERIGKKKGRIAVGVFLHAQMRENGLIQNLKKFKTKQDKEGTKATKKQKNRRVTKQEDSIYLNVMYFKNT